MGTLLMVEDRRLACSEKMLGLKKYWGPVKHFVPLRGSLGLLESNLEKMSFLYGGHPKEKRKGLGMFRRNVGRLKLVGVRLTFYPSRGHSEAVMGIFVDFFHFGPNFNPDAAPLALTPAPPIFGSRVFFCKSHKIRGCYISKSKNRALSRTYWTYKIVKYCNLT